MKTGILRTAALLLPLAGGLQAQVPPELGLGRDRVTLEARFEPAEARAGEVVTLELTVRIEPGWHIYGSAEQEADPTSITLLAKNGLEPLGGPAIPPGERHEQAGIVTRQVAGEAKFTQRIVVPYGLDPGKVELRGRMDYQACTEEVCDPPGSAPFDASLVVVAGEPRPDHMVKKVEVEAGFGGAARAGEAAVLVLRTKIAAPWHIYGSKQTDGYPTRVVITRAGGLGVDQALIPPGEAQGEGLGRQYWLAGEATLRQVFLVPPGTKPGTVEVAGKLAYMPCTEELCDRATEVAFAAKLVVEAGEPRAGRTRADARSTGQDGKGGQDGVDGAAGPINELEEASLWEFLLAAIAGALFALVMPCTYPMIPITISFFTKQAADRGGSVLPLSLTYGAGIVLIFTAIGAFFGSWIQPFAAHPVTNLVIAIVFFVFALSLFGWIALEPPKFLLSFASRASMRGGYTGVFLMGATLVVTSFTCTAPFVGSVISLGSRQGVGIVALGMAVFGLVMATPFVFLSLVPGRLQALPRSGQWMHTLKVFLGFVEIAAALKFLSNADVFWSWGLLSKELFLLVWAALFGVAALFLLGLIRLEGETGEIGPGRLVGGVAVLLFGVYCVYGASGHRLDKIMDAIAPPYSGRIAAAGTGAAPREDGRIVIDDYDTARRLAIAKHRKLLLNFTGVT